METQYELSEVVGFDVSRETFEDLTVFHDTLLVWSKTHNLVGPKEHSHIWSRHIADSLQIWPDISGSKSVVDIGSGAGFPGLVLGCISKHIGGPEFTLVEPSSKRASFLRTVSRQLKLPIQVENDRIENVSRETFDVVTSRAVADISKLLEYSVRWLENGAKAVFLKGQTHKEELTESERLWHFKSTLRPSRTDSFGAIVTLSEVRSRNV